MAFESLADKLQNTFKKLTDKGLLTEADVKSAMREVKLALLEADVDQGACGITELLTYHIENLKLDAVYALLVLGRVLAVIV